MRTAGAGRLAVLGLGLAVSMSLAQSAGKYRPAPTVETSAWWKNLFKSSEAPKVSTTPPAGPTVADRNAELDRLMKAYWRRQEVCDRLREIALQNNNDALYDEAGRLEDLAWRLYQSRSKQLGMPVVALDDEPASSKSEESTLEVLKKASATGGQLPPRLRSSGKIEPAQANRVERIGEDER
jgi:hypothetical protein